MLKSFQRVYEMDKKVSNDLFSNFGQITCRILGDNPNYVLYKEGPIKSIRF